MDVELPEDIRLLQRTVRGFVDDVLAPHAKEIEEKDEIPRALIAKMGEAGLFGIGHAEALGGQGFGNLGYCVAVEQLARVNASLWNVVGGSAGLCGTAISVGGPDDLRERYLPLIFAGEKIGAYALSEPGAGSDAGSLKTAAVRRGGDYVIEGFKTFITNAPIADVFVIFANADPEKGSKGITAFVVERGTEGLEIGKNDEKMGLRGSTTAQLYFSGLCVPASQRIGAEGDGFKVALRTLDFGRLGLAAHSVGAAQRLLEASVEQAKTRVQFGKPIGANQAIQWMLADMKAMIEGSRLLTLRAAWLKDQGLPHGPEAAIAKLTASKSARECADKAVQIHGGMGYMRELWIERAYRDARIARIYEGTSEIQRVVIAGALLADT